MTQTLSNRKIWLIMYFPITVVLSFLFTTSIASHEMAKYTVRNEILSPDLEKIIEKGFLTVAMNKNDRVPFFYRTDDNNTIGTDVDLANEISSSLGVKLKLLRNANTFDEVVDQVALGKADLGISKISRTLERSKRVVFSSPYMTLRQAILLNRKELAKIKKGRSLESLVQNFDGTLGVIEGSSFSRYAINNFPKAILKEYANLEELIFSLISGNITALYLDEFEVQKIMQSEKSYSLLLRPVAFDDQLDTIGIAVSIENTALHSFVEMFLEQNFNNIGIKELLDKARQIEDEKY